MGRRNGHGKERRSARFLGRSARRIRSAFVPAGASSRRQCAPGTVRHALRRFVRRLTRPTSDRGRSKRFPRRLPTVGRRQSPALNTGAQLRAFCSTDSTEDGQLPALTTVISIRQPSQMKSVHADKVPRPVSTPSRLNDSRHARLRNCLAGRTVTRSKKRRQLHRARIAPTVPIGSDPASARANSRGPFAPLLGLFLVSRCRE